MPTLYRPQSATEVLTLLRAAKEKADTIIDEGLTLAISQETYDLLEDFLPDFVKEVDDSSFALYEQTGVTKQKYEVLEKLRMTISHFIQTFNNAIARGIFDANERSLFKLDVNSNTVPYLRKEADVINWSLNLMTGEEKRLDEGKDPVTLPAIDEISDLFTEYNDLNNQQSTLKDKYDKELEDVAALMDEALDLCNDIIDEVEFFFRKEKPSSKRANCREYGVIYVSRPGEEPQPGVSELTATSDQSVLDDVEMGFNAPLGEIINANLGDTNTLSIPMDGTTIFNNHTYAAPGIYQLAFTGIEKVKEVHMNSSRLTDLNIPPSMKDLNEIIVQGNLFTTPVADKIVIDVNNLGTSGPGKVLSLAGSEPLSAAGLAAKAELESRGWVVIVG